MVSKNNISFISSSKKLLYSRRSMLFAFTVPVALGAIIAGKGFPPIDTTLLSLVSIFFITAAVYVYNDIIDQKMDIESKASNKEGRPLVTGEVSLKTAYIFVAICSILGLGLASLINRTAFLITFSFWLIYILYSYPLVRFKRMFIIKTIVTAGGCSLTLLVGTSSVLNSLTPLSVFAAIIQLTFLFLILPSIADSFDVEEDKKYGFKTMGMVFSWKTKARMMILAPIVVMSASIIAYLYFELNIVFPILSIISSLLYVKEMRKVSNEYVESEIWRIRKMAFAYYDLNLIYIIIGMLNLGSLLNIF